MNTVKVSGKITLPSEPNAIRYICDDCGCICDSSFGDSRVEVFRYASKSSKEPESVRYICEYCADELFGDHQPHSIFG